MTSPYLDTADTLRDNGYHPMPCMPGSKVPGNWDGSKWTPLTQWSKWCDTIPPDFLHQKWQDWPDAGVCIAHGEVVGLDIDTDRKDVANAAVEAVGPSPVRRIGSKGWMGYYRLPDAMQDHTARVRWYDKDGNVCAELLFNGTQFVIPPTLHPGTGQPYRWITEDSLEDIPAAELPYLPGDTIDRIDAAFKSIGLTRRKPRQETTDSYGRPAPTARDLEKPHGRSVNDRALEPAALDQWWPALDMPKTRQRGRAGGWEAVAWWRPSGSGRAISDRNPNLKVTPHGIRDFGDDQPYTPISLVMAARDCEYPAAVEWLEQFIRAEENASNGAEIFANMEVTPDPTPVATPKANGTTPPDTSRWAQMPTIAGTESKHVIRQIDIPSDAEWDAMVPKEPPPFPITGINACEGLLGEVSGHIENASATRTEAGALAITLPLLGAVMGQAYATPTNLRTNIYSVALGGSGTGKTSLVNPAKELMQQSQHADTIGQDRIASGSGLLQMLVTGPRRVCFLDEFGHMLQQMTSPGAGIHARQIITEFTALYSSANTFFTGTAYATREPPTIDCPHLCVFGMATPEQFWRAFGSSALEDGSIARYLVFPLGDTAPKEMDNSAAEDVAKQLIDMTSVIRSRTTGNMGRTGAMTVTMDDYAEQARQAIKKKEEGFARYADKAGIRGGPAIMRRVTENALKIALISAVGRNYTRPEIDSRDMDIGHALAWWSANVMISNIASYIADNQTERDVNDVDRFISDAGQNGRDWRDIQRKFRRIKTRDLKDILEGLCREGTIAEDIEANPIGGHAIKTYRVSR